MIRVSLVALPSLNPQTGSAPPKTRVPRLHLGLGGSHLTSLSLSFPIFKMGIVTWTLEVFISGENTHTKHLVGAQ